MFKNILIAQFKRYLQRRLPKWPTWTTLTAMKPSWYEVPLATILTAYHIIYCLYKTIHERCDVRLLYVTLSNS